MAFRIAPLVISLKVIRLVSFLANPKVSYKCQEIASPSRSSSVASQTTSDSFANFFNSATSAFLSELTSYSGAKLFSMSMANPFDAKSRTCPKLDFTVKSFPKYPSMVFAFAGDSTMTKFLLMLTKFCGSKRFESVQI
ncbi:hypothetical protein D3C71_897690 [compost metagenome]